MENKYKNYTVTELLVMDAGRDYHDPELEAEICERAGLDKEWADADGESFESILEQALEILKEDI